MIYFIFQNTAGTKIKFANEGDQLPSGASQSLEFILEEKPHAIYKRRENDLLIPLSITLRESLCGFSPPKKITSIDGRKFEIGWNGDSIKPGEVVVGKGLGFGKVGAKGDAIVVIQVVFPDRLEGGVREKLKGLL